MRIKCIKAHEDASDGFLGIGAHDKEPIDGLTLNKVYAAQVVNTITGGGNYSVDNTIEFLIYNDNDSWETYDVELFAPEQQE